MDADIVKRLAKIYSAIKFVHDPHIERSFPQVVTKDGIVTEFVQDWSGGETEADLSLKLNTFIGEVSSFNDHLRKWAKKNGRAPDEVTKFLKESQDLCIVRDLDNRHKHGGSTRGQGWSGLDPRLTDVGKRLRMEGNVSVTVDPLGGTLPESAGEGIAETFITAVVFAKDGRNLGVAHEILDRAVQRCEEALVHFGVEIEVPARRGPAVEIGSISIFDGGPPPPENASQEEIIAWLKQYNLLPKMEED